MERCSACRARLSDSPVCPRCACDFTLAWHAEANARRYIAAAIQALADEQPAEALRYLDKAQTLQRSEFGQTLRCLALTIAEQTSF